jgi:hypothetical protein
MNMVAGVISLAIVAIVIAQVLINTLVTTNTTTWDTSAKSLWTTSQLIVVAGFLFVILGVFGLNA